MIYETKVYKPSTTPGIMDVLDERCYDLKDKEAAAIVAFLVLVGDPSSGYSTKTIAELAEIAGSGELMVKVW